MRHHLVSNYWTYRIQTLCRLQILIKSFICHRLSSLFENHNDSVILFYFTIKQLSKIWQILTILKQSLFTRINFYGALLEAEKNKKLFDETKIYFYLNYTLGIFLLNKLQSIHLHPLGPIKYFLHQSFN